MRMASLLRAKRGVEGKALPATPPLPKRQKSTASVDAARRRKTTKPVLKGPILAGRRDCSGPGSAWCVCESWALFCIDARRCCNSSFKSACTIALDLREEED